jgi:hypothetical protein
MFSTKRSRVRALAAVGMAGVVTAVGAVAYDASAAQVAPSDTRAVSVPVIAEGIKPPPGSRPVGAYVVTKGVQTYTCETTGVWSATSTPAAQLIGTGGRIHHFAGPSWQSLRDGSLVTATKVSAEKRTGAIPELLLKVATHAGSGVLSKADYINRLFTSGGVAPTTACAAGQTVSVAYGAVYVFWDDPAV